MKFPSLVHLLLLALFTAIHPAAAQEPTSPAAHKAGPGVRALLLANNLPNFEIFCKVEDKISPPILLSTRGLTDAFFPTSKVFELVLKDPKNESGYRPVAKVTLPEDGKDFILLLEPAGPTELKPYAVNSKQPRFGADSVLFFNASEVPIGAELGNNKSVIPVRQITILQAPAKSGDVPYYQVALYQSENGETRRFASTRWPHRSQGRNYVFVYKEEETGHITYRGIDEPIPQEAPTRN